MSWNTYSFEDVTVSFNHPSVGSFTSIGAGVGTISISMANDVTTHDTASDGTVMISKGMAKNGLVAIAVQQTSELDKNILKWYNYIVNANASEWAKMVVTIKSNNMGDETICTGVSPQKRRDKPYQAQGQHVTWNLMSAEITED